MQSTFWYQNAIFYQVYVRAFFDSNNDGHGDIQGLTQKLDYLRDLGVDCLWIMPIYPSPLKDDGYDIADYYKIHSDYGTLEDFKILLKEAHARDIRIITDLVLNHTSDQHSWFQAGRADRNSQFRDYYVWSDTNTQYADARIIFTDTEKSNWAWDEKAGQYYWHRFYTSQPDLNYDNPAVRNEILNIMKFWLDMGVDGFRADAVPYLFERDGTTCENLPESHTFLKEMRRFVDEHYPDCILLCEANQWPRNVRDYFGSGNEFHMALQFPLMPRLYMAIRRGEAEPIHWALEQTPPIPENCQWVTFLRNHDELTLEMVTEEERQWMWREYAPDPRMRINLGIRRRLAPLLENDSRRIELANSLLFTLPGSPIIYYGDEIGMGDNIALEDRNGVRTPMQWDNSKNAGFSKADHLYVSVVNRPPFDPTKVNVQVQLDESVSLWHITHKMIVKRKEHPALGHVTLEWLECGSAAVAAYLRIFERDRLVILNNLSDVSQKIRVKRDGQRFVDILRGEIFTVKDGVLEVNLLPYQYLWLQEN